MKSCPSCTASIVDDSAVSCDVCGNPLQDSAESLPRTSASGEDLANKVAKRYGYAYKEARALTGTAALVMMFAQLASAGLVLIALLAAFADGSPRLLVLGIGIAVASMLPTYVLGVLVASQGQTLKATLDAAVYASPFLDDDQRAKIMSLK